LNKSWYNYYQRVHQHPHDPNWGNSNSGGIGAPSGNGYTKIYSTDTAFAALKADGSIVAWGNSGHGGAGAPSGNSYTKIYSTNNAFAALKANKS
jgi:hypothetical protein